MLKYPMSHKALSLAIAGSFIAVVIVLSALSAHGRSYVPDTAGPGGKLLVMYAPEPHQALELWRAQGVKGRVAVMFGRLGANQSAVEPDDSTYLYHAIREGIVREVFHVIPDARWELVAGKLGSDEQFRAEGRGFRGTVNGTPLLITRFSDLPRLSEPVLAVLQGGTWSPEELAPVEAAIRSSALASDMVVVTGDGHDEIMRGLGAGL